MHVWGNPSCSTFTGLLVHTRSQKTTSNEIKRSLNCNGEISRITGDRQQQEHNVYVYLNHARTMNLSWTRRTPLHMYRIYVWKQSNKPSAEPQANAVQGVRRKVNCIHYRHKQKPANVSNSPIRNTASPYEKWKQTEKPGKSQWLVALSSLIN